MQRRSFFKYSTALCALLLSPIKLSCNDESKAIRIVICGAGFGGLSVAKFLRSLNPKLHITLIEQNKSFISCPLSNAYLSELKSFDSNKLFFNYDSTVKRNNYEMIHEKIVNINRDKQQVLTQNGAIYYDYLIMALGIEFHYKKYFKRNTALYKKAQELTPAGLKPSEELFKLKAMVSQFKGGNFYIVLPSGPFKCPSAPYERACMIARLFKEKKLDAKVILIDPRAKPASKAKLFLEAFHRYYQDYLEYHAHSNFKSIDFERKTLVIESFDQESLIYKQETVSYEECCLIPFNRANKLYKKAGLKTYAQGWVKLQKPSLRALNDDKVYVLGDAQGEYPYPKSAQMAYSQAFLVAQDLTARLQGKVFDYRNNPPSNVCYSMITENKAISITHFYTFEKESIKTQYLLSEINKATFDGALAWYESLTADILIRE